MIRDKMDVLWRLPSLRGLYIFEVVARHLNLVKAAEELGLTQGALSRQISQLEDGIGVSLFHRHPRGLRLTEAGDILTHHCRLAFAELEEGVGTISGSRLRQTLRVAVARSYATRVLSHHINSFVSENPWIDLVLDGHRHLADLAHNEADAAIRVGDGRWPDVIGEKIEDDPLFPVASPELIERLGTLDLDELTRRATLLHYSERPYWELWSREAGLSLPSRPMAVRFSETVMMLEAAEASQGVAMARHSLVREALAKGTLIRLSEVEASDGIGYYFCATPAGLRKESVQRFREWLFSLTHR